MPNSFIDAARSWIPFPSKQLYQPLPPNDAAEAIELENLDEIEEQIVTSGRGRSLLRVCQISWMWSLVPFFITSPLGKTQRTLPKVTSTSYINGMRGFACVVVFNQHFLSLQNVDWLDKPYGLTPQDTRILQLPFVRLLASGLFMVAIFFVLSGFALSYSALRKINSGDVDGTLLSSLSSSVFRRPIRLFAPIAVAMPMAVSLIYIYPNFQHGTWVSSATTFSGHMGIFLYASREAFNPFRWDYFWPPGFAHGWTLPIEYRGSIIVFLLCVLICKMTPILRKVTLAFAAWYSMYWLRWEVFCFVEGMFIAELRFAPLSADFPRVSAFLTRISGANPKTGSLLATSAWITILLVGLLFGGWPGLGVSITAPYKWLWPLMPASWQIGWQMPDLATTYWISIGSGLVLLSLENLPMAQWPFRCTPMIYLGEISFSFYLLHLAVMHSLGVAICDYLYISVGWSFQVSSWISYSASMVMLFFLADPFWRGIDENVVKGSRKLAQWCGITDK